MHVTRKYEDPLARRPTPLGQPPQTGPGHLVDLVRSTIPPLHPAGVPFVLGPLAVALLGRKNTFVRRTGIASAVASAAFFRHPHRVPPSRTDVVVSPADGEVALVDVAPPPAELELGDGPRPRVSIFLSVLDVHVQRTPVSGTVRTVVHKPGKFLSADLAEASDANERTSMLIDTSSGDEVAVVQIAGLIARRIVCDPQPGDVLTAGDTYGLIRFGSRVDTYFPVGSRLLVELGQRAIGAETVLAELPRP